MKNEMPPSAGFAAFQRITLASRLRMPSVLAKVRKIELISSAKSAAPKKNIEYVVNKYSTLCIVVANTAAKVGLIQLELKWGVEFSKTTEYEVFFRELWFGNVPVDIQIRIVPDDAVFGSFVVKICDFIGEDRVVF